MDFTRSPETIIGVGGKIKAIPSKVTISVQHGHESYSVSADARIMEVDDKFPVLIGRSGFFEAFNITFREKDRKIVLKKV